MWGNKLGWGISAVLLAMIVGFLVLIEQANAISPPSALGNNPATLAPFAFPVAPSTVVAMTDGGDAAPIYRQAMDACRANPRDYARITSAEEGDGLKGIQLIVEATRMSKCSLFSSDPGRIVNYENPKAPLEELRTLGEATLMTATYHKAAKNYPEAMKYYEAAFSLGAKLAAERVMYAECQVGLQMLSTASGGIEQVAKEVGKPEQSEAAARFTEAYLTYYKSTMEPMLYALTSPDDKIIKRHVGDVFKIALESQEPMWRVEAALQLGRIRYNAGGELGRAGDQRGAKTILKKLMNDDNRAVQAAAKAAYDLTLLQFRTLR